MMSKSLTRRRQNLRMSQLNRYDDLPKPGFQLLATPVDEKSEDETQYRRFQHVKLSRTHTARITGKPEYVDVDYVYVGTVALRKEDKDGTFTYEETLITASDEDGEYHEAILYLAPRALSLDEAMFAIGEL